MYVGLCVSIIRRSCMIDGVQRSSLSFLISLDKVSAEEEASPRETIGNHPHAKRSSPPVDRREIKHIPTMDDSARQNALAD